MITFGEGKYKVFLEQKEIGNDLVYMLYGGEKHHIGGVVTCEPEKKPNIICIGTHRDHVVLAPIAKTACKKYNKTVVALGGIHIDNATKEEIQIIVNNCKELEKCI